MSTAIIFASHDLKVLVIDIPLSLELANGGGRIFSSKAPGVPYATPEPKGKKRQALLASLPADHVAQHEDIQKGVKHALQTITSSRCQLEWCLPRTVYTQPKSWEPRLIDRGEIDQHNALPLVLSILQNDFCSQEDVSGDVVLNPSMCPTLIQISGQGLVQVPAKCTFLWDSVERATSMLKEHTSTSEMKFDVILMDPPWANRSVRNGYKYSTTEDQSLNPFDYAMAIVEMYLKPTGLVAVWITNKAAVRRKVMKSLPSLGYTLFEEWVWIKVTSRGEYTTPLDGVWRSPYELLLVFRQGASSGTPSRRYIFAVPDIHSRKPNLKELFSKLFQPSSVIELFARNLTAGWWCIGDEVLKFQHESAWSLWPEASSKRTVSTAR